MTILALATRPADRGDAGDEQVSVAFDKAIRILLAGQAGGRAFYANGGVAPAGVASVEAIDRAYAADDVQRVYIQLGGAAECQLDTAVGGKIVCTYHLMRFGTAAFVIDVPPPDGRACSAPLASNDLVVTASAGAYSDAILQGVANSGSKPFASVGLDATP